MSINAKLNRLSLDLHNVNKKSPPSKTSSSNPQTSSSPVAESWEDESLSDSDPKSPSSTTSTPIEAPGPSIKSPTTLAVDAAKELSGEAPFDNMPTPPPTPISPQMLNAKIDWSPATVLGGGRPTYSASTTSSNPSSSTSRSTPTGAGTMTPTYRYPTPNPPTDSTARDKRPEKTTATANRLIAGALGIRAPPKTEEQRKYERAVKEQEIKRRNREREEKKRTEEEEEKAKAAVWGS